MQSNKFQFIYNAKKSLYIRADKSGVTLEKIQAVYIFGALTCLVLFIGFSSRSEPKVAITQVLNYSIGRCWSSIVA